MSPSISDHYAKREPSSIRKAQILFQSRPDFSIVEVINLAIGNISLPMHPAMLSRLKGISKSDSPFVNGVVQYTASEGTTECKTAILNSINAELPQNISKDINCVITDGGSQAMELMLLGVCGPSSEKPILFIDPTYTNYIEFCKRLSIPYVISTRKIQSDGNFSKIDTSEISEIIDRCNFPIKVILGIWLDAEISNHKGCSWLTEPIPDSKLDKNASNNETEVRTAIELANKYKDIIVAVNVGNEALVSWNDHMMSEKRVIKFIRLVKENIEQPVTVAETHYWWRDFGTALAKELDFIGVHIYPLWEGEGIENGISFTIKGIDDVISALPNSKIAILEAGWASKADEFGERATIINQKLYYNALKDWADINNITVFFFEAFDEPWKGDANKPNAAEKNWGVYYENRTPKLVLE